MLRSRAYIVEYMEVTYPPMVPAYGGTIHTVGCAPGDDIHLERTYGCTQRTERTYARKRHTYGRDIHTEETYTRKRHRVEAERTYTRKDIHPDNKLRATYMPSRPHVVTTLSFSSIDIFATCVCLTPSCSWRCVFLWALSFDVPSEVPTPRLTSFSSDHNIQRVTVVSNDHIESCSY